MFSRVLVASSSPIKLAAVRCVVQTFSVAPRPSSSSSSSSSSFSASALVGALFAANCSVESFSEGKTCCPQPVGEQSARACIARRFATAPPASAGTLLVGIENYIHSQGTNAPWYDRCLAMLRYQGGTVCDEAMTDIEVPEEFEPQSPPDIIDLPLLGYAETCGERVAKKIKTAKCDDWYQVANDTNPSRQEIVQAAFRRALEQLLLQQRVLIELASSSTLPATFSSATSLSSSVPQTPKASKIMPKTRDSASQQSLQPENLFLPLIAAPCGCQTLTQCLVNQVNAAIGPVRLEKNDSLGAPDFIAQSHWRDSYFIVGVGERSPVIAALLAARIGVRMLVVAEHAHASHFDAALAQMPERCIVVCYEPNTDESSELQDCCRRIVVGAEKRIAAVLCVFDRPAARQHYTAALQPFFAQRENSSISSAVQSGTVVNKSKSSVGTGTGTGDTEIVHSNKKLKRDGKGAGDNDSSSVCSSVGEGGNSANSTKDTQKRQETVVPVVICALGLATQAM